MQLPDKFYWAALATACSVGVIPLGRFIERFSAGREAWESDAPTLVRAGFSQARAESIVRLRREHPERPEAIAAQCRAKNIDVLLLTDPAYPPLLKEIYDPPGALYVCGRLDPAARCLAVVGARRQSAYGKKAAEIIAGDLARADVAVVSGAAYGIDAAAHRGALKVGGYTIAVLGCGADVAYPASHAPLLQEILARGGAIVSEYPPGMKPYPAFFPQRNRIISGLSWGTVVVEAAAKSGSLITAELALSEGRDVFAVPGSIFSGMSEGTNHLIQQGAKLVTKAADVLAEYPWHTAGQTAAAGGEKTSALTDEERKIYDILTPDVPLSVDEIIYRMHGRADASNVAFLLLQMELKNIVESDRNHGYTRTAKETRS